MEKQKTERKYKDGQNVIIEYWNNDKPERMETSIASARWDANGWIYDVKVDGFDYLTKRISEEWIHPAKKPDQAEKKLG